MHNFRRSKSKFSNQKLVVNGMRFDSKKEYERYLQLLDMLKNNEIKSLQRQVEFVLIPHQTEKIQKVLKSGKIKEEEKLIERRLCYVADFVYTDKNDNVIVEDVKGMRTHEYIIKRKLMLYLKGIRIKEL